VSFDALRPRAIRLALLTIIALPLLAGCIGSSGDDGDIAWQDVQPTVAPTTDPDGEELTGVGGATGPLPTTQADLNAPAQPHDATRTLSPEQLLQYQPNEMGVVPVLQYHYITTNPDEVEQFIRLADDMRSDLEWLYANNFYIVPLSDVVNNAIQAPPGKHPVALTFDDGTASQFAYLEDDNGDIILDENGDPVIDPDTAVGILEEFYARHPDAGSGAHFAPLIFNAFAIPTHEGQADLFDQKVLWMVENGYEIGNHTWQHTNLTDISTEEFMMTVAEPQIYMNELLGDHPGNASDILTLPYGTTPDPNLHPDQRQIFRDGFTYNDQQIYFSGALLVGADPSLSPAHKTWDKLWIPRIQMFKESIEFWFGMIERGELVLYTSDGNPDTIVIPDPQHPSLDGMLDTEALEASGKQVIAYNVETGEIAGTPHPLPVARREEIAA
jgi:hypothetical protein